VKLTRLMVGMGLLIGCYTAVAQTADLQYSFAQSLAQDGEEAFALLEFKRFIHLHSQDARVPDALLNISMIYLTYAGDLAQAKQTLAEIKKKYAGTQAGKRATDLATFLAVNSDFAGKPLIAYLRATADENRGRYAPAAAAYLALTTQWPAALLGDDALLSAARLQVEKLNKPKEALTNLQALAAKYPKSSLLPEAHYLTAVSVEKAVGPGREAVEAYRQAAAAHPKTEFAKKALARANEIEKMANILKRQFDKESVLEFRIVRQSYEAKNQFTVTIELSAQASQRQVQATLEEALLTTYEKRQEKKDSVQVKAYYNYPLSKAGKATWSPGKEPAYSIEERKSKDVLKDAFFDLLKRR